MFTQLCMALLLLGTTQYLSLVYIYSGVVSASCSSRVSHLEVVLDDGAIAETQEEFVPVGMHRVHLHAVVMGEQLHSRLSHNKQHTTHHNRNISDAMPYLKLLFVALNL